MLHSTCCASPLESINKETENTSHHITSHEFECYEQIINQDQKADHMYHKFEITLDSEQRGWWIRFSHFHYKKRTQAAESLNWNNQEQIWDKPLQTKNWVPDLIKTGNGRFKRGELLGVSGHLIDTKEESGRKTLYLTKGEGRLESELWKSMCFVNIYIEIFSKSFSIWR